MHIPVMLKEVLQYLGPLDGKICVDCTFGAGGYTKGMSAAGAIKIYAIDCDPHAMEHLNKMPESIKEKVKLISGNFADLEYLLESNGIDKVDCVVMDLGVSSMQLDVAERGFSFNKQSALDMRMSQDGYSAHEFVNKSDEREISDVIYKYGDERNAKKIARNIVNARNIKSIDTTTELADIVRGSFLHARGKIDLATKTFQAIRIFVNDELNNLSKALDSMESILKIGGRLVVVTFHSLEDVIVKQFIKEKTSVPSSPSRYVFIESTESKKDIKFKNLTKKAIEVSYEETKLNPRSRSAKLRAIEKII